NKSPDSRNIRSLVLHSSEPAVLDAGTSLGGVFKSTDGGRSWTVMNTGLTNQDVLCLAVDPSDPQTLFVGTNEGGVCKSTSGGQSWTAFNAGLSNTVVRALAIDRGATFLLAGTEGGVFDYRFGSTVHLPEWRNW